MRCPRKSIPTVDSDTLSRHSPSRVRVAFDVSPRPPQKLTVFRVLPACLEIVAPFYRAGGYPHSAQRVQLLVLGLFCVLPWRDVGFKMCRQILIPTPRSCIAVGLPCSTQHAAKECPASTSRALHACHDVLDGPDVAVARTSRHAATSNALNSIPDPGQLPGPCR